MAAAAAAAAAATAVAGGAPVPGSGGAAASFLARLAAAESNVAGGTPTNSGTSRDSLTGCNALKGAVDTTALTPAADATTASATPPPGFTSSEQLNSSCPEDVQESDSPEASRNKSANNKATNRRGGDDATEDATKKNAASIDTPERGASKLSADANGRSETTSATRPVTAPQKTRERVRNKVEPAIVSQPSQDESINHPPEAGAAVGNGQAMGFDATQEWRSSIQAVGEAVEKAGAAIDAQARVSQKVDEATNALDATRQVCSDGRGWKGGPRADERFSGRQKLIFLLVHLANTGVVALFPCRQRANGPTHWANPC